MSDIPLWNCEFFPLKDKGGIALDSVTVGAVFGWKCHGDLAVSWDAELTPALVFPTEEDAYTLAILKVVRQDPNDVQYEVTGYKAGPHEPKYIRVLQGHGSPSEKGFEANAPKWQIKSVLDPQKPPQAYPALGPWHLSLPLWVLVAALIALLLTIYLVATRVRKYTQRRRMLEELRLHKTALSPLHQFYRDARQLRRRMHTVKDDTELKLIGTDLEREFRLYVLRQFQIPALDWSNRAILEDLRKRHRKTYRFAAEPLKRTLRELGQLKGRARIEMQDVEQLHRMSLDAAERLDTGGRK